MGIYVRRGMEKDFDSEKMKPGEWAVSIDSDRRKQKIWMCFAPGVVKRMGTYEDFEDQIEDATDSIKQKYLNAFNEILAQIENDKNIATEEYNFVVNFRNALEKTYIPSVTESVAAAASSAKAAATSESNASTYKNNAASSATAAANSAKAAATSESNASTYKNNAASSATAAANSAKAAATSESNASTYKNNAASSATAAANSQATTSTYMDNTKTYMNNAKTYMETAKTAAASITGALKPKGTVTYANLPTISDVEAGSMYNISNTFTSDSRFKDGGNIQYPAGTNVYKTTDGMWDCLAGQLGDYLMKDDIDTAVEEAMPDYTASANLTELVAGEKMSTALGKIKTAVKNVISLVKLLGTTDISKIGNGTVTGALSTHNNAISAQNNNLSNIAIKTIEQGETAFSLRFSGVVLTRQVVAILLPSGQQGTLSPVCISFRGAGAIESISSHKADVSENNAGITGGDNATVNIPSGICGNWGKFTIISLNKKLSVDKID